MAMLTPMEAENALRRYVRAFTLMHECAGLILTDQCPPRQEAQLCRFNDEYWDGICVICWQKALRRIEETTGLHGGPRHEDTQNEIRPRRRT